MSGQIKIHRLIEIFHSDMYDPERLAKTIDLALRVCKETGYDWKNDPRLIFHQDVYRAIAMRDLRL